MAEPSAPSDVPRYPEHEKMAEIRQESQAIGEFLEWAGSKGLLLCVPDPDSHHGRYFPDPRSTTTLLAEFFEIDQDKIEAERRQMLAELRAMNERSS